MKTTFRTPDGKIHSADVITPDEIRERIVRQFIPVPQPPKRKRRRKTVTRSIDPFNYVLDIAERTDKLSALGLAAAGVATLIYLRG